MFSSILAAGDGWTKIINYELIPGNEIWRFVLVLVVIIVTLAAGRIAQFFISLFAQRREKKTGENVMAMVLKCIAKPVSVVVFALGLIICRWILYFSQADGIKPAIATYWDSVAKAVAAVAVAYAIYKMVDVVEFYLVKLTSRTRTKLDDMLVPVVRKSLRITIVIIAALWIADGILGANIRAIFLSAGVGGIAIALAAKDTVANFFGSLTIFTDRPFQIDDLVKIEGYYGTIEEVGFRSTRVRTLEGTLVTIPNNTIANTNVENVGRRRFIRRTSNITITYDAGAEKSKQAVEIIKNILADVPEVSTNPDFSPKVFFNDFNDSSLNIYMTYWVVPPDWWLYLEVNQRVNTEMMKRFEAEGIEFAFPTQTLYLKKEH